MAISNNGSLLFVSVVTLGVLLAAYVSDIEARDVYKDKKQEDDIAPKSQLPLPKDSKTIRKSTLLHSAWVIISIVLLITLGAIAVYYWVLFYPILCKKERKYDVMQMSAKP
ncbi:uncharacterized protein LOC126834738 isoform X2 [Adelges cooleyi]|uniref:uncharacterized protein LOC126834738 isoform X2 n=1 Tax=Adelges cooleyi TaxID=133065 RepID=UPI0021802EDA|nr:uncharacterized protein LOC126834738 isoform X2 [Adelges cooleyi]